MATQISPYAALGARQTGIRVALCEPDPAIRAQLRAAVSNDPLLILAGESHDWNDCESLLDGIVPELLFVRSELIPSHWSSRIDRDSFLPVVIALRSTLSFDTNRRVYHDLRVPADPQAIRTSLDRAVRDVYDRKAKQLLYLVDRYVAASHSFSLYKTVIQVERDGSMHDLPTHNIVSVVAARKHVSIHSIKGRFLLREPIHQVAARLDPTRFVRIHRSVIINLEHIDQSGPMAAKPSYVLLSDGSQYSVGPNYRETLADAMSPGYSRLAG